MASAERTLDPSVLIQMERFADKEGDRQIVTDLVNIFLKTTPQRLNQLDLAVEQKDLAMIKLIAHSLKSSCGYLGAQRMRSLCIVLEDTCISGELGELPRWVESIHHEYSKLKGELEIMLG
jgi:HPt (histidine-containing phosphotransfer) domain-containing protein